MERRTGSLFLSVYTVAHYHFFTLSRISFLLYLHDLILAFLSKFLIVAGDGEVPQPSESVSGRERVALVAQAHSQGGEKSHMPGSSCNRQRRGRKGPSVGFHGPGLFQHVKKPGALKGLG